MHDRRLFIALLTLSLCVLGRPTPVAAHGLFGHVHVTGYAVENLPPGELKTFFSDPDVFGAAIMGATFTDTGYALGTQVTRDYTEAAHWEPMIQALITHIRTTYGPTYDTPDERRLIAFVMGMASHGQQDELYDSTYDLELREQDGEFDGDTFVDGFFNYDQHARLYPTDDYVPFADLLQYYAANGQTEVTEEIMQKQIDIVLNVYVNDGFGRDISTQYGETNHALYPWTYAHYLDPSVPGSFGAEIAPNLAYLQAIWDRLHGRFDEQDLIIHAWPDSPRRLRSSDHTVVASYVTVVFGVALKFPTVQGSLVDANGQAHPFELVNTRWGTEMTRTVQFRATSDYVPGGHYVAHIDAGAERVDGEITTLAHDIPFQVECATADASACPDVGAIDDPVIDGSRHVVRSTRSGRCGVTPGARGGAWFGALVALGAFGTMARRARRRAAAP